MKTLKIKPSDHYTVHFSLTFRDNNFIKSK